MNQGFGKTGQRSSSTGKAKERGKPPQARRSLGHAIAAIAICATSWSCSPTETELQAPMASHTVLGAGATFPAPLYKKWLAEFHAVHPDLVVEYQAVGSGAGVSRFIHQTVDFGASDAAMSDEEISQVDAGVQLVPTAAGSIVVAYNLPQVESGLKLRRATYVDVFLGKIVDWDDARIQADNPGVKLPALSITIAARQDSSGTTFAFTNHLAAISNQWRDGGPGIGKVIDWPGSAMLGSGNEAVAGLVKRSPGTIGYVEFGVAERAGLAMARLENKAGHFVAPTSNTGLATLADATLPDNLRAFFPDPDGAQSYPIVTYTWLMLYRNYESPRKADDVKRFVRWCLTAGQQYNESFGYIRLTPQVASRALQALDEIQ